MPADTEVSGRLRDLYVSMFKAYFKLPDEIGRLKPRLVFDLIDGLAEDEKPTAAGIPPHLRAFYGL